MGILKKIKKTRGNVFAAGKHNIDLMASPVIDVVNIEFTSRCNLKCVYCAASQPDYKGTDLDPGTLETLIESLKDGYARIVNVNGHGETTIYKDWHRYCNKMLEMGLRLHITSNFAREFSHEELKTLSGFEIIAASCDTADPVLHKKLRRSANLPTLCLNIAKIREMALGEDRQPPRFTFNCVVSDQNVLGLTDYVVFAGKLGIKHINFCSMKKYPDIKGSLNPVQISEMPVDLLPDVKGTLKKSIRFLKRSGISFQIQPGLLDSLEQKIENLSKAKMVMTEEAGSQVEHEERELIAAEPVKKDNQPDFSSTAKKNRTRDCLDPWSFIMVRANKEVLPCCWYRSLHSSGKHRSLFEVFNNTKARELRRRLLTGDLPPDCMDCTCRAWTSTDNLKKKVWNYVHPGIVNKLLSCFRKIPEVKTDILIPFEMVYGKGWYGSEVNPDIADPEWQRWRWTSKEAGCLTPNPQKEALLIIGGSVDKSKYTDQKVIIKINGHTLDTFVPTSAKFLREYRIKKDILGKGSKTRISIKTDRTFIPSEMNQKINDNRELGIQIYRLFFGLWIKDNTS